MDWVPNGWVGRWVVGIARRCGKEERRYVRGICMGVMTEERMKGVGLEYRF